MSSLQSENTEGISAERSQQRTEVKLKLFFLQIVRKKLTLHTGDSDSDRGRNRRARERSNLPLLSLTSRVAKCHRCGRKIFVAQCQK